MKISSSLVKMTSDRSASERDSLSRESALLRRPGRVSTARVQGAGPGAWDRVSLTSGTAADLRTTYAADLTSESRIQRSTQGESGLRGQETLVQRLVSGVLDQEVSGVHAALIQGRPLGGRETGTAIRGMAWVRETRVHVETEQVSFSSRGQVETADGRNVEFALDLSLERSLALVSRWEGGEAAGPAVLTDPLVISLDDRAPRLTDTRFSFDLNGDGTQEEISFVSKGSGFLAFDTNGDGRVNDGSELFGPASGDGFQDLARYDLDRNGWIDEADDVFSRLSVWTRDGEGRDQLVSLKEAGVGAIFLGAASTRFDLRGEADTRLGQVAASGVFLFEDGRAGLVQEIDLAADGGGEWAEDTQGAAVPDPLPLVLGPALSRFSAPRPAVSGQGPFEQLEKSLEVLREQMRLLLEGPGGAAGLNQGSL